MIMQGYLLTIGLLVGRTGLLLVITTAVGSLAHRIQARLPDDLKAFWFSLFLVTRLGIVKCFPTAPGPVLLGDLFPADGPMLV